MSKKRSSPETPLPNTTEKKSKEMTFVPNKLSESNEFRKKEIENMLKLEDQLIKLREKVASERRKLSWVKVKTDYKLKDINGNQVLFSQLFNNSVTGSLIVVYIMFKKDAKAPCPMCSCWADNYTQNLIKNINFRANFVCLSANTPENLKNYASSRNWTFPWYSTDGTTFGKDFLVEKENGNTEPAIMAFTVDLNDKNDNNMYHTYTTWRSFDKTIKTDHRAIDFANSLWHFWDIIPQGRGNWYPKGEYGKN